MESNEKMIVKPKDRLAGKSPPGTNRKRMILAAFDEFEKPLTRYAHRMFGRAGDLELAQDAVQHTFMKLCEQELQSIENRIGPWLFQVCRNRILDQLRSKGHQTESWPEPMQVADSKTGPAEKVEQADFLDHLSKLIGSLSGTEREVIELWSQGFGHAEVAKILNKSPESVRMALSRGLKNLRQHPQVNKWLERATGHCVQGKSPSQSSAIPAPKRQTQPNLKPR
jgi:RNA polymerase sigma-70 factor (ECF subfamily)